MTLRPVPDHLDRAGQWLARQQKRIRLLQWGMIAVYLVLLLGPALIPLPARTDFIWNNAVRFAQFAFWGVWWPFVLLSTALVGRFWCGILCPEGALSEWASERGAGRAIPAWLKWPGWPTVAFIMTTIYGQLTSVYQYPAPAVVVLGGSTLAAIAIGARYGKAKRVWCRFLCPVSGVFGLLAKIAPLHFKVDGPAWHRAQPRTGTKPPVAVNCAPLVPIKTMRGAGGCHMCGRCSGYRGAIRLAWRSPNEEIVAVGGETANGWETFLITAVLMGMATGALQWSGSALYVTLKAQIAIWCLNAGVSWPLDASLPWWMLTNYPGDRMTLVDGAALLIFIAGAGLLACVTCLPALSAGAILLGGWSRRRFHHLAQALIPVAAAGLFCGLLSLTVTQLRMDGVRIPMIDEVRSLLVGTAGFWSLYLVYSIAGRYGPSRFARLGVSAAISVPIVAACGVWALFFLG
ncbi:4Fe-4S binding protein [Rhizobium sullae]|nr:4Fe-4S binding protein [Rhizobium sullae]